MFVISSRPRGEFSVEVEGLRPNGPGGKLRVLSMMDGARNLFNSELLFNVQYRGVPGNPDNCATIARFDCSAAIRSTTTAYSRPPASLGSALDVK